jgi:hypothetical protein
MLGTLKWWEDVCCSEKTHTVIPKMSRTTDQCKG